MWTSVVGAPGLWCTGLVALRHVGSSPSQIEPVSPALEDKFFTTEPPGKTPFFSSLCLLMQEMLRDQGLIPGSGRYPGGGHGNPLQYSCLENPVDRGVWRATVHRVAQSDMTEAA